MYIVLCNLFVHVRSLLLPVFHLFSKGSSPSRPVSKRAYICTDEDSSPNEEAVAAQYKDGKGLFVITMI